MPFGKYKGTPLSQLDGGYLHWLASKLDEWQPPLRDAIVAERARRKGLAPAADPPTPSSTPPKHPATSAVAVCDVCGLRATAARPLVHAVCATAEVPF
jgi:hypothetical protein